MSTAIEAGTKPETRILRNLSEIREISPEWRDLFRTCRASAFQSPDWLLPWIEVFSPEKMMLVEVRSGNRLIGLAPLLIYNRDGERVLAFMGGGVSDYLDVLIRPEFEAPAIAEICRLVLNAGEDWTALDLTDLPVHSPLVRSPFFKEAVREHDLCSILRLPTSPIPCQNQDKDELLRLFSKRQRANLRNARSRLNRAGGSQLEIATQENRAEFLSDLFLLHTTRWSGRGKQGVLADERIRCFHLTCAPELLKAGILHLARLRLEHRTLAVIYSLFSDQRACCYLQGFDPEFASLSSGTQLMYSVICDALDRGMREFDFLRGEEAYKQHWRPERRPTYRIQITRRDLAAVLRRESPTSVIAA